MTLSSFLSASQALVSEIQNKTNKTQQNGIVLGHISSGPWCLYIGVSQSVKGDYVGWWGFGLCMYVCVARSCSIF